MENAGGGWRTQLLGFVSYFITRSKALGSVSVSREDGGLEAQPGTASLHKGSEGLRFTSYVLRDTVLGWLGCYFILRLSVGSKPFLSGNGFADKRMASN